MTNTFKFLVCFGLILLGVLGAERAELLAPLKERLQLKIVPSAVLASDAFGEALRQLDLLHVVPNDYAFYEQHSSDEWDKRRYLFQRKSRVGIQLYGIEKVSPQELPSTSIIHQSELENPAPLLSVVIDPADLNDPTIGIVANPQRRGMAWERPAFFSYFERGELQFATGVGLRLHGGKSRIADMEKSFRAYFREVYGETEFKPGLLFDESSYPLKRLVLHNDRRDKWHLVNPLAYDIARRIGGIAPQTKPVRFFLNGIFQGVYVITEHLSDDYLKSHYGHDRFVFFRTRQDSGSRGYKGDDYERYKTFKEWATAKHPLSLQEAEKRVDLENLTSWILSILFCAPTDAHQGPALLDLTAQSPRWFWINWDMDHSFQDKYKRVEHPWELDTFREFWSGDPRVGVFYRLMDDPAFRDSFERKFVTAMNHLLSQEFLDERVAHYERIAIEYGITGREYLDTLRQFFRHRKAVLRQHMHDRFESGISYRCQVETSQQQGKFEIDGYPETSGYSGWYFAGMPIRVKFLPDANQRLSYWMINGRKVDENLTDLLETVITADTKIEAVLADQQ